MNKITEMGNLENKKKVKDKKYPRVGSANKCLKYIIQ